MERQGVGFFAAVHSPEITTASKRNRSLSAHRQQDLSWQGPQPPTPRPFAWGEPFPMRRSAGAMIEILMAYEPWTRLGAFAGVFIDMALWELMRPKRQLSLGRRRRWSS